MAVKMLDGLAEQVSKKAEFEWATSKVWGKL